VTPRRANDIGYGEFANWYGNYRAEVLEPALNAASSALDTALSENLSHRDRTRITSTSGRVKSKSRTWRKIMQPRYEGQIATLDDIPTVLDDLVGLRVTCINVRDIDMVQSSLDALPRTISKGLWLDPTSERNYVVEPKESGYRGWHVNLGVTVGDTPVSCELQVRTLLQDSWGELTHIDTYSKDGALPPLVDVLSTRMADLLSILDDIAEDLRTELDRIDHELVAEQGDRGVVDGGELAGEAADAAVLLRNRWKSMDRPTDLAALAWALQREFGAEVSDDWFGHGSFKRFLRHAVPEGEISTGRQAYLLPLVGAEPADGAGQARPAAEPETPGEEVVGTTAPGAARQLRRIDPEFPLLESTQWPILFEHLAEAWRRAKPVNSDPSTISRLTRSTRDMSRSAGAQFSRRNLDYVVKALLAAQELAQGSETRRLAGEDLAESFAAHTIQRMLELRVLDDTSSRAATRVTRWIAG
jgi:ppGpp synthetase/RelA/SpoT-type nucleotidyltranferase